MCLILSPSAAAMVFFRVSGFTAKTVIPSPSGTRNGLCTANLLLQLHDAVDKGFSGRRATGHIHIHRHNPVAATYHRITIVVIATAVGTRTHADHPARLSHLVVD